MEKTSPPGIWMIMSLSLQWKTVMSEACLSCSVIQPALWKPKYNCTVVCSKSCLWIYMRLEIYTAIWTCHSSFYWFNFIMFSIMWCIVGTAIHNSYSTESVQVSTNVADLSSLDLYLLFALLYLLLLAVKQTDRGVKTLCLSAAAGSERKELMVCPQDMMQIFLFYIWGEDDLLV